MFRIFAALVLSLLSWPAAARPDVQITVTRATGGDWLVDYRFARKSAVWFFPRSADDLGGKPWRPQGWTVETPGVTLTHAGRYDALSAGGAALTDVRIRMRPFAHPLVADYTPALAFSDGGLAFYSHHFWVVPIASIGTVAALPSDLVNTRLAEPSEVLTLVDPGRRLLLRGRSSIGQARFKLGDTDTYIYSGAARLVETDSFGGMIDPGLPAWVRGELDTLTPRLMRFYAERLGPTGASKPMALVAWQGADKNGWSMGGSVLTGMVVMQISGKLVLERNPSVLARMRWFIGHESAHFWLGQVISYSRTADGWMTEGGADLLAIRSLQALVPDYDAREDLQGEVDTCLKLNGFGKPLATALERGEHKAQYACGALLMLAAEGAAKKKGSDLFGFVRTLIDAHRKDGRFEAKDWLRAFEGLTGDPALSAEIGGFLDRGVSDPTAFWVRLFTATGVDFTLDRGAILLGPPAKVPAA